MIRTDLFKRKKVSNQEKASSLTLEQLKQTMNTKFEEVYDYLDKIKKASLDEGGVINGNLDVNGNITKNKVNVLTEAGGIIDSPFYDKGKIKNLPAGNDNLEYWLNLPNGVYWYNNTGSPANMPYIYGFVEKIGGTDEITYGNYNINFYCQTYGLVYRKSGNKKTISDWYIPHRSIVSYFKSSETFTLSAWTWRQLTMNDVHFERVYNNELSYYNGGVKIGKNVHRVMAQAAILGYHSPTTGTKGINIYNSRIGNNVGYLTIQSSNQYSEYWKTIETPWTPLEVQEGDVLFLNVLSENGEDMVTNYILLTVEVIE